MNDDRPYLMQSLPNSGSSWLAALMAKHLPGCRYRMEFFNPIRNSRYSEILRYNFGCELVSCYKNIATFGDSMIGADITETWGNENYTFTKEVFSPLKTAAFNEFFQVFIFLRREADSFPPSRLRVWSFYEHAWHALKAEGYDLTAITMESRAHEAHNVLTDKLIEHAADLGIPVVWYEELFEDNRALMEIIKRAVGLELPELVTEIMETRKVYGRKYAA